MSPSTRRTYGHKVACLLRFTGKESVNRVTQKDVDSFRAGSALAASTVESAIQAAEALSGKKFTGEKLQAARARVKTIPLDDISRVYAIAKKRQNVFVCRFLKWAYITGFRLGDLLSLTREQMAADVIELTAGKTKRHRKYHAIPRHPILNCRLPNCDKPLRKSPSRLRTKLYYYCDLAKVPHFSPQMIRRTTTTQYELARPGAGGIIQGSALRGSESTTWRYYIDQVQILSEAQTRLQIPEAMLPKSERTRQRTAEKQLLEAFRRAAPADQDVALRMVRGLV